MSIFSKLLAVFMGAQSFPQPFRRMVPIVFLLSCVVAPTFLIAQTGGRIAGAVKDATGAVIPNSQVVLANPANGVKQNAVTGNDGVFTFAAVPVGQYELDVIAAGFNMYGEPVTIEGTELLARCVQHETDHLDGVLFIDRMDTATRKRAMREIRESNWDTPVKFSPHRMTGRIL